MPAYSAPSVPTFMDGYTDRYNTQNTQGPRVTTYVDPTTGRRGYRYVDAQGNPIQGQPVVAPPQPTTTANQPGVPQPASGAPSFVGPTVGSPDVSGTPFDTVANPNIDTVTGQPVNNVVPGTGNPLTDIVEAAKGLVEVAGKYGGTAGILGSLLTTGDVKGRGGSKTMGKEEAFIDQRAAAEGGMPVPNFLSEEASRDSGKPTYAGGEETAPGKSYDPTANGGRGNASNAQSSWGRGGTFNSTDEDNVEVTPLGPLSEGPPAGFNGSMPGADGSNITGYSAGAQATAAQAAHDINDAQSLASNLGTSNGAANMTIGQATSAYGADTFSFDISGNDSIEAANGSATTSDAPASTGINTGVSDWSY